MKEETGPGCSILGMAVMCRREEGWVELGEADAL